MLSNYEKY